MIQIPTSKLPEDRIFLGAYDRLERGFRTTALDVESDYVSWENSRELSEILARIRFAERVPMITIEPFTTSSGEPEKVLQEIVDGENDLIIKENARIIKFNEPQLILVRFAHEMELVGNYPWSQSDAELYVHAYQHYVDIFREQGVSNVLWIWSPAGNENAGPYYPGDNYADYIGISILGFEDWDLKFGYPEGRSFQSILAERLWLTRFKKPIIITELGVSPSATRTEAGALQYKYEWLWRAWESWYYYPSLKGVVYFNALNAENAWQGERPDWRVPADALPPAVQMPPIEN